ncbi:MAG TPA: glutathione S-transferase family protein [Pseudomonadales bacterium]|nr:glutathione S-transferase family protein [Pseudomonadales bacterium]
MKLYIANKNYSSWSLRPWVLMRELSIEFEEVMVFFEGADNHEQFKRFSPSGRVPCLVDGDTTVWDSLAIIEYLAEQYPKVWPEAVGARSWARCAAAEMHSGFTLVRNTCGMSCGVRVRLNEVPTALSAEWDRIDELWREGLAHFGGPFLAGEKFTAVDAFFAPVAFRIQTYSPALSKQAGEYANRILALAPMIDWYKSALQETARDPDHERETLSLGVIVEDLRAS